jgi:hypothetical protein
MATSGTYIRQFETPAFSPASRRESAQRMAFHPEVRARSLGLPWIPPTDFGVVA